MKKHLIQRSISMDQCMLLVLVIFSAVKISLFNCFLLPAATMPLFALKLLPSILMVAALYALLMYAGRRWLFVLLLGIQTVYIMASLSCYMSFHSYLQLTQAAVLLGEAVTSASHSATPWSPQFLILLLDLPFFVYVVVHLPRIRTSLRAQGYLSRTTAVLGGLLLTGYCSVAVLQSEALNGAAIISRYGTVANNLSGIVRGGTEEKLIGSFDYGANFGNETEKQGEPNFVILQVESMDAQIINQTYQGEYITPFLHSLTQESVYYPYMLSYHKGGGTSDIEFSVINSVEPLDGFPAIYLKEYDYRNSLVSRLGEASYRTMAFHGNYGTFYSRNEACPKMGFNVLYDIEAMGLENGGWGALDGDVLSFAADKMKAEEAPFLSYIITMTSHTPFTSAGSVYNNPRYEDIQEENVRNYFNSMSYVDQSIRAFITDLQQNLDNTYIFILGDHTPNVSNEIYKQAAITIGNEYLEFVPLMLITPDQKVYRESFHAVSMLDISPTILKLSGIPFQIHTNGGDLMNPSSMPAEIPLRGFAYNRGKLYTSVKHFPYSPWERTLAHWSD